MSKISIDSLAIECFENINFLGRYKALTDLYGVQENRMTKMNKSNNLMILKSLDPSFKLTNPGQLYVLDLNNLGLNLKFMSHN